jgi:DNA-binding NarL/FixJ family response regulator
VVQKSVTLSNVRGCPLDTLLSHSNSPDYSTKNNWSDEGLREGPHPGDQSVGYAIVIRHYEPKGIALMDSDRTLLRQTNASVARAEIIEECGGNILYLDEQHLTRDCIGRELARRLPEFRIIELATARDFAAGDPSRAKIALVILYVHADRMILQEGCEDLDQHSIAVQLSILEDIAPEAPRVLMSEIEVPEDIIAAFRRHVRGYVPTTLPIKQVAEAIRFVAAGGTFVPQSILTMHWSATTADEDSRDAPASGDLASFSPRQNEVLRMLWNGSSNKVIAFELRMSESTVKVHIRHIMKKLNVNNRTQVVLRTRPQGLDKDSTSTRLESTSGSPTAKAIISLAQGSQIHGQTRVRRLDLSKDVGMHSNSRRG